jgi:Rieske Fe-S protein
MIDGRTADDASRLTRINRRRMLALLGGSAAVIGTLGAYALYSRSPAPPSQGRWLIIRLSGPIESMKTGEVVALEPPPGSAFLMADGSGTNSRGQLASKGFLVRGRRGFIALAAECSHLGCRVNLSSGDPAKFVCPCHASTFALDGLPLHAGPAPGPLSHLEWQAGKDSTLMIAGVSA